jgi:hypothetical protein
MAIREGRWDCSQCGTKKILGRDMSCPRCGRKRPEKTHFYLADGEPEVTDLKQIVRAKIGPDWYCGHCNSGNKADETSCSQCGAGKDSPTLIPPHNSRIDTQKEIKPNKNKVWLGISGLLLLSATLYIFWPRQIILEATGFRWERSINIEIYKTVIEEDWNLPNNGRKLKSWQDIRTYRQVLDHYETRSRQISENVQTGTEEYNCGTRDLGNGYFEDVTCSRSVYETRYHTEHYQEPTYRDEPIYDTKHRFEIDKWIHSRTESARSNDQRPYWPEFTLINNRSGPIGNERKGNQSETYIVYFISKGKNPDKYEEKFDMKTWKSYISGGLYSAKLSMGKLSEIKPTQDSIKK